ncbi:MAG: fimbrillin family protein [Bacteroidales bacterium]|nr:fimbrillin family protein [Bacteroidales bacterium]
MITHSRLSITLLLVLAFASCVQNIPEQDPVPPMLFSAVASHSTKGIISTTNYPLDEPFAVQAVYYSDASSTGSMYIPTQTVMYNSEYGQWKTSPDYYWPEGGSIHFYAGSPILPEVSISTDRGVEADWTISSIDDALVDLCFAEATENCANHSVAVPLVFSHALSQVCFKARTLKNYSYSLSADNMIQANVINVVLDSVKVRGIVSKGHFVQHPLGWSVDDSVTSEFVLYRSPTGLELRCDRYENPILTTINTLLFIPQILLKDLQLEEWHHVSIRSSVTDTTTGQIIQDLSYTVPRTSVTSLADYCTRWVMDYKYTFRLAVGLEDTELTATLTDWTETKEIILGDE